MKNLLPQILKAIQKGFVFTLILILAVVLVGFPSQGLIWLAGGGDNAIDALYVLWPIAVFVLVVAYLVDCGFNEQHRYSRVARAIRFPALLTLLTWYCLPMIMNGLSHLLRANSMETAAKFVYDYRWFSLPGSIIIPAGAIFAFAFIKSIIAMPLPEARTKKLLILAVTTLLFAGMPAMADTEFVPLDMLKYTIGEDVGSRTLNMWEKNNPQKKLMSGIAKYEMYSGGLRLLGFWVIFEKKDTETMKKERVAREEAAQEETKRRFIPASR